MLLFHWSPAARRGQILRRGLVPGTRPSLSSARADVVCLADSPSWAWALSGNMGWAPAGSWDLWQVWLDRITDPILIPSDDRPSGVREVRTKHRIYKRDVWYVASRDKDEHR